MHPLLSSSLFPWEAKSTVFGCVGEVKVSFLPVTHTSRASIPLTQPRSRTFAASPTPAFWSVPKNFTTRDSEIQSREAP